MASPFSEPTKILQIFGSYKSQVKSSMNNPAVASASLSVKRPLATKLVFDDSMESEPKMPRFNRDPFDNITGRKRFTSENTEAINNLQAENEKLKDELKQLKADKAGDVADIARMETRLKQQELTFKKERIESEQKLERATRLYRNEKELVGDLEAKMKRAEERIKDRDERNLATKRHSLDKRENLEQKVKTLRETRDELQDQVTALQEDLDSRPDIDNISYKRQLQEHESEVADLRYRLSEAESIRRRAESKLEEQGDIHNEYQQLKEEKKRALNQIESLEGELAANRDAYIQRKCMQEKLDQFADLERENHSLKSRNTLLLENQRSFDHVKEELEDLKKQRSRLEIKVQESNNATAELDVAREELKSWRGLLNMLLSGEQRSSISSSASALHVAREALAKLQGRELELVHKVTEMTGDISSLTAKLDSSTLNATKLQDELTKVKGEQAEQARLIKKLQRKTLLISKERDSAKGILESVEKEMTLSGNQWEQEKIVALEKTLEEYKAMVNMLMDKEDGIETMPKPEVSKPEAVNHEELEKLRQQLADQQQKYQTLEMELERRAIKGDFNPADTKVIHFKRNPTEVAVERRRLEVDTLQEENDALKARVKLLEEGQTKDITMMVGQRLEEGASSKEVLDLKEELKSSDLKNKRLMEMFKKTSKEFREFVLQTTGFRIDKTADNKYKMYPIYAEHSSNYLLFQMSENGIEMLESEYSLELSELMELHLEQNNSIPMFLAGLIVELFREQQVGAEEHSDDSEGEGNVLDDKVEEEEDDDDDDNDSHHSRDEGSQDSDDVICVDDD